MSPAGQPLAAPASPPRLLRCGDLALDESRWTVHRAGTPVDLSPTESRLLACLLRHQGSTLTRAQLLQHVWGRGYTGQPQVVETYVSYLRRKLHRLGPPLIHTRRGAGYTLHCADPAGPGGPDRLERPGMRGVTVVDCGSTAGTLLSQLSLTVSQGQLTLRKASFTF